MIIFADWALEHAMNRACDRSWRIFSPAGLLGYDLLV
jgi:hypothetical protein